jgi:hypothetical protein
VTPNSRQVVLLVLMLLAAACGDDAADVADDGAVPGCLDPLPLDCEPTFAPTFAAFYRNQIRTTCGASSTGTSCHAGPDGQLGLVLADEDSAYDYLLGEVDGRARVIPGDPECSILVQRLESSDPDFVMPVGMPLLAGERCAVRQWIANGAER